MTNHLEEARQSLKSAKHAKPSDVQVADWHLRNATVHVLFAIAESLRGEDGR